MGQGEDSEGAERDREKKSRRGRGGEEEKEYRKRMIYLKITCENSAKLKLCFSVRGCSLKTNPTLLLEPYSLTSMLEPVQDSVTPVCTPSSQRRQTHIPQGRHTFPSSRDALEDTDSGPLSLVE